LGFDGLKACAGIANRFSQIGFQRGSYTSLR
jgi:hypothetical protein